jgi:hypothetical protein
MKKLILFSGLLFGIISAGKAQSTIEFIPQFGYTFADQLNFGSTFGRVEADYNFGGAFQFNFSRHFGFEMMYNGMQVPAKLYNYGALPGDKPVYQTTAGINYIMAGPVSSFTLPDSRSALFFGADLGAAIFTPHPNTFSSNASFAYGFQAGANIYMGSHFGLRLSGRLLGSVPPSSGYYFGNWGYPQGYYYSGPGLLQFGFSAGLIIGLGKKLPTYQKPQRHYYNPPPPPQRRYYYY